MSNALKSDHTRANVNPQDRAMLDYVAQLSKDATRITPEHIERLRQTGFDDRAIVQINLLASWFHYINRVADGLGVGR